MRKLNVIREMRKNWKPARKLRKGDAITGFGVVHAIIPYHTDTDHPDEGHHFVKILDKDGNQALYTMTTIVEVWT